MNLHHWHFNARALSRSGVGGAVYHPVVCCQCSMRADVRYEDPDHGTQWPKGHYLRTAVGRPVLGMPDFFSPGQRHLEECEPEEKA